MANNVSRLVIVTNGTAAANMAAMAAAGALPGLLGQPKIMIQVVSAPALIAAQNAVGNGNAQSVVAFFNPTLSGLRALLPAGQPLFQSVNWTPMLWLAPIVPLVDTKGQRLPFKQ
jgi:hypothetical protein